MIQDTQSRRAVLIGATALFATSPLSVLAQGTGPVIHVLKDPDCGCCSGWIDVLENDGFSVTTEPRSGAGLARYKVENGIPEDMVSCHTARIEGYLIEGHVPVDDIRRLLDARPDAVGLAVPGMPYGAPGMGPESERDAYEVFLIRRDGSTEVYSSYAAA